MREPGTENLTQAKRWFRVRWIHDLETTQHALSEVGSSCRWSTMWSRISGGREGDIVVCSVTVKRWRRRRDELRDRNPFFYLLFLRYRSRDAVPSALWPSHCPLPIFVLAARAAATITLASPSYMSEPSFVFLEATRRSMRPPILAVVYSHYCVAEKERCRNEKIWWNTLVLGTFAVLEKISAAISIPVPTSSPPVAPSICSHGFSF